MTSLHVSEQEIEINTIVEQMEECSFMNFT